MKKSGENRTCAVCGITFYAQTNVIRKGKAKYCSAKCRVAAVSKAQAGVGNWSWKGDYHEYKGSDGYVYVRMPDHHRAVNKYTKRATLVAEEKIGRELLPGELVHHINRIRDDDSPENISVVSKEEHNAIHCKRIIVTTKCLTCGADIQDRPSHHRKFCNYSCAVIYNKPRLGTGKQCQAA